MQNTFDKLYSESKEGKNFRGLYEIITSRNNILLAYRTIKSNKGSKTAGTDELIIEDYKTNCEEEFVEYIKGVLTDYKPKSVRRVFIPKANGDKRPLGIPSMIDRLIQQMFKQVLEPIAEAKFYKHSYGFRPLRKTHQALSRCQTLINKSKLHYVVDIDIKGFFDNVNHTLLIKQLWNLGIQDKRVLVIISKMLKAPIKGVGVPLKGTPQGGILSPLLSNIVLNDLDQWVAGQWEQFEGNRDKYSSSSSKYRGLRRKSQLKEGYIVRYADDFKIFTKDHKTAYRWFHAIRLYLKDRLKLDISPEKSKVINLRKNYSDFLGYKLKAVAKGKKVVAHTYMKDKKKKEIKLKAKSLIKQIYKRPSLETFVKYNQFVLGLHNYFKFATHVNIDFHRLEYDLYRLMYNRFSRIGLKYGVPDNPTKTYNKFYKNNYRTWEFNGYHLYPMADIKFSVNYSFRNGMTPFTEEGRTMIYKELSTEVAYNLQKLMASKLPNRSIEYMDNRLSRYSMVRGQCEVTGWFLQHDEVHCHHFKPTSLEGGDDYNNLRIVHKLVHTLIHATTNETIDKYMKILQLNARQLKKLNSYREACNLNYII